MLMKMLTSLKFLMCQGLAIYDHSEKEGNLFHLLKCRAEDVSGLEARLNDAAYKSSNIISKLVEMMALRASLEKTAF